MAGTEDGRIKTEDIEAIKPIGDHIIVKRADKESETKGGIIIPGKHQQDAWFGTVISVGPGKLIDGLWPPRRAPMPLKPGDTIYFKNFLGWKMVVAGKDYFVLCSEEVLGVLAKNS